MLNQQKMYGEDIEKSIRAENGQFENKGAKKKTRIYWISTNTTGDQTKDYEVELTCLLELIMHLAKGKMYFDRDGDMIPED